MSEEFKILSQREHILKRSGMYIGSTTLEDVYGICKGSYKSISVVPGLLKIINEILDNSVDEFIRTKGEYANKISIDIDINGMGGRKSPLVTISDNGRGIPVEKVVVSSTESETVEYEYRPVAAWTRAMAGTNFSDNRETMGANGVGSFCTNVYSTYFCGETSDGKNNLTVTCGNNGLVEDIKVKKSSNKGTTVSFIPDMTRFGDGQFTDDHFEAIEDRLENLAFCFPGLKFTFNKTVIKSTTLKEYASTFGQNTIQISLGDNGAIIIAPSDGSEEFRLLTYVNGLYLKNGGTHIDYLIGKISDELRPMIKRKFKVEVLPNHIKQHLLMVAIIRNMVDLEFDGQTKERLTNNVSSISSHLGKINFKDIAKKIIDCPDIIEDIVRAQLNKLKEKERREAAKLSKENAKTKVAKHIEPNSKQKSGNILYLVEGDSAKVSFLSTRDKLKHGIYPLRGKFINITKANEIDILNNDPAKDIMGILGLMLNTPAPEHLNYGYSEIRITSDADIDGYSITAQIINFLKLWPELFDRGVVKAVKTPIMVTAKGNKVTNVFYTLDEYSKYTLKSGEHIEYLKGLGSLDVPQYREFVIEHPRVELIEMDENAMDYLHIAFSDDVEKRKEWIYSNSVL